MGGWKCCRELGESSGENHGGQNTRVYYCGLCITLQRSISSLPPWNMLLVSYLSHSIIIIYLQYFPVLWASPVAQLQCGSESACSAAAHSSILAYTMDYTHGVTKSQTQLSDFQSLSPSLFFIPFLIPKVRPSAWHKVDIWIMNYKISETWNISDRLNEW